MKRTDNYLATIAINTDPCFIDHFEFNAKLDVLRQVAKNKGCTLRIRGRLGKDSPHKHLYTVGGNYHRRTVQDIRIEHATRIDVYLKPRYKY